MTVVLRILLAVGIACGVLTPIGGAVAADAKPLNVVFVNPGKTGEVYWDMVAQTMQAAADHLAAALSARVHIPVRAYVTLDANADFRHQFHAHARMPIAVLQVMNQLGQILNGINVVMRRR